MKQFFFFIFFMVSLAAHANLIDQGNEYYLKGEHAPSFKERETAFNDALSFYFQESLKAPSPYVNQLIGDTFFQLEEYPWAILYYERVLKEQPKNKEVRDHLSELQKIIGIAPFSKRIESPLIQFLFFFTTFLFCSLAIWFNRFLYPALVSVGMLFCYGCYIIFSYYSSPLQSTMVKPSGIYSEPELSQPQMRERPLKAGTQVGVIKEVSGGDWLEITDFEGVRGFVPALSVRIN